MAKIKGTNLREEIIFKNDKIDAYVPEQKKRRPVF